MPQHEATQELRITLVFIINGQEVPVVANVHAPLHTAVQHALAESNNLGRPIDEWETRSATGVLFDTARKIGELGLTEGDRLFVSLRVGAGGSCA